MKSIGKVLKVFIPEEYKKDELNSPYIGFQVLTETETLQIILKIDDKNSKILKGSTVLIEKIINDGKVLYNLELMED